MPTGKGANSQKSFPGHLIEQFILHLIGLAWMLQMEALEIPSSG
jgi:hypothetical protein